MQRVTRALVWMSVSLLNIAAVASAQPAPTIVETEAQLLAWAANPVTPVEIRRAITLSAGDFVVTTSYDVTTTSAADLSVPGRFELSAPMLDLGGDIEADEIRLSADDLLLVRSTARLDSLARTHLLGTGALDLRGDIDATDVEIFVGMALVRAGAMLDARGNLNIGAVLLDVYGDLRPSGTVNLYGDEAVLRSRCLISPGRDLFVQVSGHLDFKGKLERARDASIQAGSMEIRRGARLRDGGLLEIDVAGNLDHRGQIFDWDEVYVDTDTYRLYGTHVIEADYDCELTGTPHPKSVPATGCDELGP